MSVAMMEMGKGCDNTKGYGIIKKSYIKEKHTAQKSK